MISIFPKPLFISKDVLIKRRFTWAFCAYDEKTLLIPDVKVKVMARPNIEIEETEINFLANKPWIPGKKGWDKITVEFIDFPSDFAEYIEKQIPNIRTVDLNLLDGRYMPIEKWRLTLGHPHKCMKEELQDCLTHMNIEFRYDQVEYITMFQQQE